MDPSLGSMSHEESGLATIPENVVASTPESLFLRLPAEIRIQIYNYLIPNTKHPIIIRTFQGLTSALEQRLGTFRARYRYLSDRIHAASEVSTYHWVPDLEQSPFDIGIMGVNRQIHGETCQILYSNHLFSFGKDIESIVPFFQDLTEVGRACVKQIGLTKRSLLNTKDFDSCEWKTTCEYIAQHLSLDRLDLEVYGVQRREGFLGHGKGHEVDLSRERVPHRFYPDVFETDSRLEWARQLGHIRGLKELNVQAVLENCFSPGSDLMNFFLAFSAAIETDLARWLETCTLLFR